MAMFATLHVPGMALNKDGVEELTSFYFLGAKDVYTSTAWETATGIKDVTATHEGKVPLVSVGELVKRGIVKTVNVRSDGIKGTREIRYSGLNAKSIDNDQSGTPKGVVGLVFPPKQGSKWGGQTVSGVSSTELKVIQK